MRQTVLLLIFLAGMHSLVLGQSWHPIAHPDGVHFLYPALGTDHPGLRSIKVDRVEVTAGDSIFYFNRVTQPVQPGDTFVCGGVVQISGSTTTVSGQDNFLGASYRNLPGGLVEFTSSMGETFRVDRLAGIGDSWLFSGSRTATVDSVVWGSVLGQPDSLKYISVTGGKKMVLSKGYGLVSTFPFVKANIQREWSLSYPIPDSLGVWGIPSLGLGKGLPGFTGIMGGFSAGDYSVFQNYKTDDHSYDYYKEVRKDFLSVSVFPDSIQQSFMEEVRWSSSFSGTFYFPPVLVNETIYRTDHPFLDLLPGGWVLDSADGSPQSYVLSEVSVLTDGRVEYLFLTGAGVDSTSCQPLFPDMTSFFLTYQEGLGRYAWEALIWSVWHIDHYLCYSNGVAGTWGTCPVLLSQNEPEKSDFLDWTLSGEQLVVIHGLNSEKLWLKDFSGRTLFQKSTSPGANESRLNWSGFRGQLLLMGVQKTDGRQTWVKIALPH